MYVHNCTAITLKGSRCKKNKTNESFCWIHSPKPEKESCSICLDEFDEEVNLECTHSFCKKCIYIKLCKTE